MTADDEAPEGGSPELAKFLKFLAEAEKTGILPRRGRRESDSFAFAYRLFQQFREAELGKEAKAEEQRRPDRKLLTVETPTEPEEHALREPVTDLFDEADEVVLVYELPGAARKNIRYRRDGDVVRLEAQTAEWLYRKSVVIEARLADRPPRMRLRNGVLELRLLKEK
jgi:HSP20 family protein